MDLIQDQVTTSELLHYDQAHNTNWSQLPPAATNLLLTIVQRWAELPVPVYQAVRVLCQNHRQHTTTKLLQQDTFLFFQSRLGRKYLPMSCPDWSRRVSIGQGVSYTSIQILTFHLFWQHRNLQQP